MIRRAALELLERNLVHVYRVRTAGADSPDAAIYTVRASVFEDTITIRLDDWGLEVREEGDFEAF